MCLIVEANINLRYYMTERIYYPNIRRDHCPTFVGYTTQMVRYKKFNKG